MKILYDEEKTQEDSYKYTINQGGELGIKVSENGFDSRYVTVTFLNGELESVHHAFGDFDLRSSWHVYGAISEKIKELEAKYCDPL